tara:strand:- start:1002 stop:1289 length:288 start_codon:yes stop_codon:yes gene_type:complete
MPTFEYSDKNRIRFIEYEVRPLNLDGDAIRVDHFETKQEAIADADYVMSSSEPDVAAVVVERHIKKYPAWEFSEPENYETVHTVGNADVITLWNL